MLSWPGEHRRHLLPHVLLFVAVLIWSGNTVISKIMLRQMTPEELALIRFSIGVLGFHLPVFLLVRRHSPTLDASDWRRLLIMGIVGAGTSMLLFTMGLNLMPATYVSLVQMTAPPLTALLAWLLFREILGWTRAAGTAIAFGGAAVLVSGGQLTDPQSGFLVGAALLIASQLTWAIYTLLGKPLIARRSPLIVMSAAHVFAVLSLWPLSVPIGGWGFLWHVGDWSIGIWLGMVYLGIVNTGLSQVMFLYALREVSTAQAVSYSYLQPPMTALMAMVVLGEQVAPLTLGCGAVIIFGLWLVNRPRGGRTRPATAVVARAPAGDAR
jgi:drug/metabolite transporter (DMT)-like permease